MLRMSRITGLACSIFFLLLGGCGGGGSGSGGNEPTESQQEYSVMVESSSGGITNLLVSDNYIYYNEYNSGEIQRIDSSDGKIDNVYVNSSLSIRHLYDYDGSLYFMTTMTNGGVYSVPDNAEGLTTLVEGTGRAILDVFNDGTNAYWVTEGQLLRTPLVLTSDRGELDEDSVEVLFEATAENRLRVVFDGDFIYASESLTGDVYRISTEDGSIEFLTNLPGPDSLDYFTEIPLFATKNYLYALVNEKEIYCIAKDGSSSRIVFSGHIDSGRLSSDGDGLFYWYAGKVKKILDATATSIDITDVQSINSHLLYLLPVDDSSVYWTVSDFLNSVVKIYSAPKNGGDVVLISELEGNFETSGVAAADTTSFYWVASNNTIVRVGKNGEEPTIILRNPGAGAKLSLYDGHVLIGDTQGVKTIPKTGQATLTEEFMFPSERSLFPKFMTGEGDTLYLLGKSGSTGTFDVYSFGLNSKESKLLASLEGSGISIIPYRDRLFVLGGIAGTTGGGTITVVPKNGIDFEPETITWPDEITSLYEHDDILYFLSDGNTYYVELTTQEIYPSEDLADEASGLLVDDDYIYWMSGDSVFKMPQGGGIVKNLFSGNSCYDFEADENYLYVAAGFKLIKIPKK